MFHFPTFPPHTLCVQVRVTGHDSCRVSPFGNPRITARLTAPRGLSQPPTSFFGSWCQGIHRAPLLTWPQRCSRPLCSSQGTGGSGLLPSRAPHGVVRRRPVPFAREAPSHTAGAFAEPKERAVPVPSGPNSVLGISPCHSTFHSAYAVVLAERHVLNLLVNVPPLSTIQRAIVSGMALDAKPCGHSRQLLLRKEVIQPHLPVRLPCYDFVPIADPTFDGSLLTVGPPASGVTDFRDVTGGVYKARERIHRSVADLRLLATPTSWGRVADPNPN